ncbi:hypothetical protein I4U23_026779 [Adineta vaga]|nr:hypothetical protein I4U23_026779 [Adineta vaga]
MISIQSIVFVLLISSILIDAQTFSNCGSGNHIKLNSLTISPYPVRVPGPATFTLGVGVSEDIKHPLQTAFDLKATALGITLPIKCENGVGSCTYADWCTACSTCTCPVFSGDQQMVISLNFTSGIPIGSTAKVRAQIDFQSASGQKGCVLMPSIDVRKK